MPAYSYDGSILSDVMSYTGELSENAYDVYGNLIHPVYSMSSYVTSGIALWLDGEFNATIDTHDAEATIWKDLSGNGYDFTLNNTVVLDKGMKFNGTSAYGTNDSADLITLLSGTTTERTIEIVCKLEDTGSPQTILLGKGASAAGLWYRPASGGFQCYTTGDTTAYKSDPKFNEVQSLSQISGGSSLLYQNLDLVGEPTAGGVMNNTSYVTIGARYYSNNPGYFSKCTIYAIRIYNRHLTAEEQLNNFIVDKQRFGIVNTYDKTIMTFNIQRWLNINSDINLMDAIFSAHNPSIVGFQEYYLTSTIGGYDTNEYLLRKWNYSAIGDPTVGDYYTKAVASHHPITDAISVDYSQWYERRSYQKMYVQIGDKRIAVFNTHLDTTSYNASGQLYKYIQANELLEAVSNEKYFIIVADLNTTCTSTADLDYVNQVKPFIDAGYNVANCNDVFGFNNTWTGGDGTSGDWDPTDNIITSSNIRINSVEVDQTKLDANTGKTIDHLPLVAHVTIT